MIQIPKNKYESVRMAASHKKHINCDNKKSFIWDGGFIFPSWFDTDWIVSMNLQVSPEQMVIKHEGVFMEAVIGDLIQFDNGRLSVVKV